MRIGAKLATCAAMAILTLAANGPAAPIVRTPVPTALRVGPLRDGSKDFDFFMGSWTIKNRRLKRPLTGSTEWYEFPATSTAKPILGGLGNTDEYEGELPTGHVSGIAVRLYSKETGQWTIYWANSARGLFEPAMTGEFKDGRAEFYDQEFYDGKPIYVRNVWSDLSANSVHWEQAFSADGGKTWETNWIQDMTRRR